MRFLKKNGMSPLRRISRRIKLMRQGRLKNFGTYLPYVYGKGGLEIGGPSAIFKRGNVLPIYEQIGTLDNCDFSKSNVWANHTESFTFDPQKASGKTLFCEASALVDVSDSSYDFVLSSHNLEHLANPIKVLREWQRVLRPDGALVLVLPYYRETFDHRRKPTSVDHMFHDYEENTGEDDLKHLSEILEKHDLARDPGAGSWENFHQRSLDNISNRCLHHHVFDEHNSRELLSRVGFEVLDLDLALPFHICILARMVERISEYPGNSSIGVAER
jgi:SAM-dependent methyltransferase